MMPYPSGVALPACGDDDVKSAQSCDRLALIDGLGKFQVRRVQQPANVDSRIEAGGMAANHLGFADGERIIEIDRRGQKNTTHQQNNKNNKQNQKSLDG